MKKLAKLTLVLALAFAMAFTFAACGGGSSSEDAASSAAASGSAAGSGLTATDGELHMATNAAFPPYEMTTDDGGFEGIDVEIATEIAKKLGLELVVDDMDFSSVLTAVQGGKSDIAMAGLTVTDERKKNVDFTDTYAKGVQSIIVSEDSDIKGPDDLKGKKIGCQEGTTGYIYCADDFGEENVNSYTNGAIAVQALVGGKVDAVVIDNNPAKEFVKANKGLVLLDTAYAEEDYAIGVSKDNPELTKAVNTALKELKEDGTVDKIIEKYIKAE